MNPQVFKKADISEAIWSLAPAGGLLRVRQHDKVTVNFHGFNKSDEARLRSELGRCLDLELRAQEMHVSGHNWGQLAVHGSSVAFEVHSASPVVQLQPGIELGRFTCSVVLL